MMIILHRTQDGWVAFSGSVDCCYIQVSKYHNYEISSILKIHTAAAVKIDVII